jgi:hypothetical protein
MNLCPLVSHDERRMGGEGRTEDGEVVQRSVEVPPSILSLAQCGEERTTRSLEDEVTAYLRQ